jgi:hypothetical protein
MDRPQVIEKRFIFHANAVAFAAHIRRPSDHQFQAVASSCLPVTGGLAQASSGPQNYQEIVSFTSASTNAQGDFADARRAVDFTHGNEGENELSTNTFVDSKLTGLKIAVAQDHPPTAAGKKVTFAAEQLHARLESSSDRRNPIAFRSLEVVIKGISLNGRELIVTTAPEVCSQNETYEKLVKAYEEDGKFRKEFGSLFYPTGHEKTGMGALLTKHTIPNADGLIVGTVVKGLKWSGPEPPPAGTEIQGNRLTVEGIGSIYFGEFIIDQRSRRLTLLRFQLGSPFGADGAGCDVQSNGQSWPPQAIGS